MDAQHRGVALLGAASVCLLAVVAKLVLPPSWSLASLPDLESLGEYLFGLLKTDLVCFAAPAAFFRLVVPGLTEESRLSCIILTGLVGAAAWLNTQLYEQGHPFVTGYEPLAGVLAASYVLPCRLIPRRVLALPAAILAGGGLAAILWAGLLLPTARAALGLSAAYFCDRIVRVRIPGLAVRLCCILVAIALGFTLLWLAVEKVLNFLLPIEELVEAYQLVGRFLGADMQTRLALRLLVVTFLCQVSLGFLGIAFVRKGQERKLALIDVGEGRRTAGAFSRLVFAYMVFAAAPYMAQRTVMENINYYFATHIQREAERSMRIGSFFPGTSGDPGDMLLAAVQSQSGTVEGYTDSYNQIVALVYSFVESKLFALPKLMLLPGMLVNQPLLVLSVLPASIILDLGRTQITTTIARRIEALRKKAKVLNDRRRKIEEHDTKNEELIRRGATTDFVQAGWRQLAKDLEDNIMRMGALMAMRRYMNWLFNQDIIGPCIELVLAWLLENHQIPLSDIQLYTRVIEETIDFLLTRQQMDASLANLRTDMDRVSELLEGLEEVKAKGKAAYSVQTGAIRITGMRYKRGTSLEVSVPELELAVGRIYAVTGANGSGKSSFFGILASCGRTATLLPAGLQLQELAGLTLPSEDVAEITQQPYCPLFAKPLAWLLGRRDLASLSSEELQALEERVVALSRELEFHRKDETAGQEVGLTHHELNKETDDWYGKLSGGQRGKAEFIRQVFLRDKCPGVLLLDEAFAPLDPASKQLVQRKLKEFCAESVLLVIYHGAAGEGCVPADDFFDASLHFSSGSVNLSATC